MNVKQISSGTEVLSELSLGTRPASTRFTLKELSSALHHGARVKPVMRPTRLDQVKARGPLPIRRADFRLRRGQTEVDKYDRTQYRSKEAPYEEQRDHEERRDLLLAPRRAQCRYSQDRQSNAGGETCCRRETHEMSISSAAGDGRS